MSIQKPSQDMLYRYTQRKLSEEEEEQVELWLMENPEGLEAVRLDHIQVGNAANHKVKTGHLSIRTLLGAISWASAVVIGVVFTERSQELAEYTSPLTASEALYLDQSRSAGSGSYDAVVELGQEDRILIFELAYDFEEPAELVISGPGLKTTRRTAEPVNGIVTVFISSQTLRPGVLHLTLESVTNQHSYEWNVGVVE